MRFLRFVTGFPLVVVSVAGLTGMLSLPVQAHINVLNAQVRLLPPVVPNTSAYFKLVNDTTQPLVLVSGASPVSEKVEIHNHIQENGVMKMVHMSSLTVPAGETLAFQPGGYHLMLFGLKKPLKEGQTVPVTLTTQSGFTIAIEAKVTRVVAKHHHH